MSFVSLSRALPGSLTALGLGLTRGSPGKAGVGTESLCWFPHLPRTLCISSESLVMDLGWLQKGQGEVAYVSSNYILSLCSSACAWVSFLLPHCPGCRGGRPYSFVGRARLLFYTSHIIGGGVVLGARKGWEAPNSASPLGRLLGSALLLVLHIPVLFLWVMAWRYGKATVSPSHGADKSGTTMLWSQNHSKPRAVQHQCQKQPCRIKSSFWTGSVAWHRQYGFQGFVHHSFPLSQAQEQGGRFNQRKQPPSCLCPRGYVDVTYGEHPPSHLCPGSHMELSKWWTPVVCKTVVYTVVTDIVAVTVCSLFHGFFFFLLSQS